MGVRKGGAIAPTPQYIAISGLLLSDEGPQFVQKFHKKSSLNLKIGQQHRKFNALLRTVH